MHPLAIVCVCLLVATLAYCGAVLVGFRVTGRAMDEIDSLIDWSRFTQSALAQRDVWRVAFDAHGRFISRPSWRTYRNAMRAIRQARMWLVLDAFERKAG